MEGKRENEKERVSDREKERMFFFPSVRQGIGYLIWSGPCFILSLQGGLSALIAPQGKLIRDQ